mmetsp:Transcript_51149/g.79973  ORF Transcript_51149/g.79973 Transcript_51149/m.79973 type:complete len:1244 (-) Transcript_51149:182-3913(-)
MARSLQVDYEGHSYKWFNVDDMMEVHGSVLTELLVEGLAQYFHVPAPFQVLCDREGPIASSSDIRRTLQSLAPRLWLFDCRRMGKELRAQCQRRIEDLSLELGASRQRIAENGSAGKARATFAGSTSPPPSPPSLLPWVTSWQDGKFGFTDAVRLAAATPPDTANGIAHPSSMVKQPAFGEDARTPPRMASDTRLCQEPFEDGVGISQDNASTTELRRWRLEFPTVPYSNGSNAAATGSTYDLRRSPDVPGFGMQSDATGQPGGVARAALAGGTSGYGLSSSSTNGSSRHRHHSQQIQSPLCPELGGSAGRTVEVILRKTLEGQVFGFTNVPEVSVTGRCCLRITKVSSSGLLAAWNTLYPAKSLSPGDRVLSVNGVSEDLAEMRELLCGSSVRLIAERYSYEEVIPASVSVSGESFAPDQPKLFPVDSRAERLQHQIAKAEERMSQGGSATSSQPSKSPSPWQPHFRNDLLEKERRIEELERQLLLWQLSESKPGKARMPEWRRPWRQGDDANDDGSNDGEKMMRRSPSATASPEDRGAATLSHSPSREEQEFLRQQLQRKVDRLLAHEDSLGSIKVSAPVQVEAIQTQADRDKSQLHQRLERQTEEMATWRTLMQQMEQQVADLAQQRLGSARADTEEALLIRFPSVPLPTPPNFESHLPVCLAHLGATRVGELSMHLRGDGDTVVEIRGPLPALQELCSLPLKDLQVAGHRVGEVWRESILIDPASAARSNGLPPSLPVDLAAQAASQYYIGSPADSLQPELVEELKAVRAAQAAAEHRQERDLQEWQSKATQLAVQAEHCQTREQEWVSQARRAEEEARQQAMIISEMKAWESREQQLAAQTEELQRRKSLARAAERDEDARELRVLRQREADIASEAVEQQAKMQELQAQRLHEQKLAMQAKDECNAKARELQEWQLLHTEEMNSLEKRAVSSQQDVQQIEEQRKKAMVCEQQVQSLQNELRKQEAVQEQLRAQATSNAAQSDVQTQLAAQLEQLRTEEQQAIYAQEERMLVLEESELQKEGLVAEAEAERDRRSQEMQYWQSQHSQEMQALERQRSEAAAAMRSKQELEEKRQELLRERDEDLAAANRANEELKELQARELAAREQRIKELEAQMAQMALPKEEPVTHEEDLSVAVEAGPPDYVAVDPDDELDVRLGEEIALLGSGILRGEKLARKKASTYVLGDKKIFCKLIDGNVHVRERGNHYALASWLHQMFAETPAGDDDDPPPLSNPWADL